MKYLKIPSKVIFAICFTTVHFSVTNTFQPKQKPLKKNGIF